MRKLSKSRGDDDNASSTNGSIMNDEQVENAINEKEIDTEKEVDADEKNNGSDEPASPKPTKSKKKKGKASKSKGKTKGKKSNVKTDADADAENNEADEDTEVETSKGKGKTRGRKSKGTKDDNDEEEEDAEEEYEVEKIIDSKKIKGKLHYLIRWKGYSSDTDTWEPEDTLSCPDLISKFNEEKENDSNKGSKTVSKKGKKRKSKTEIKSPAKKAKTEWDSKKADENAEYEVERILEVRVKKNGKREFMIHWKGWSNKFDSWEPESNLNCSDMIEKFMEKVEAARKMESRSLRVAPGTTNRFTLQAPSSGRRLSKRHGQRQRVRYDDAE